MGCLSVRQLIRTPQFMNRHTKSRGRQKATVQVMITNLGACNLIYIPTVVTQYILIRCEKSSTLTCTRLLRLKTCLNHELSAAEAALMRGKGGNTLCYRCWNQNRLGQSWFVEELQLPPEKNIDKIITYLVSNNFILSISSCSSQNNRKGTIKKNIQAN